MKVHPTSVDYARAVQRPVDVFRVEAYRRAVFDVGMFGQPAATSGAFAVVFKARVGGSVRALRFLTQPVESSRARYAALAAHFRDHGLVDAVAMCEWHDDAITVKGQPWPMIDLQWVEGSILDRYVADLVKRGEAAALRQVAQVFRTTVERLQAAEFAHGDLQPGNIMIDEHGRLRLVDFDGSWAPAIAGDAEPNERGHPDFQHPGRSWGRWMDTFPALVIYTSLVALAADAGLWAAFNTQNNLILSADDLADPSRPVWDRLRGIADPELTPLVATLERLCRAAAPPEAGLAEVLADPAAAPGTGSTGTGDPEPEATTAAPDGDGAADGAAALPWWLRRHVADTAGTDGAGGATPAAAAVEAGSGATGTAASTGPATGPAGTSPLPLPPRKPEPTVAGTGGGTGGGAARWPFTPPVRTPGTPPGGTPGVRPRFGPGVRTPGTAPGGGTTAGGSPGTSPGGPAGTAPGTGGATAGSASDARRRRRRLGLIGGAVALVVAVLVGVALYPFDSGSDPLPAAEVPGVTLLAATAAAPSPFGADFTQGSNPPAASAVRRSDATSGSRPAGVQGDTAQLYAGSRGGGFCDRDALAGLVGGSPNLPAWVTALRADSAVRWPASTDQKAAVSFVKALTPAVLRSDTLVTSQRFTGTAAEAYPVVLQAGTVVLVDARGVPRVRCSGGVPLTRADPALLTDDTVRGDRWPAFAVGAVQVVNQAYADVGQFELGGVSGASGFRRPAASTGDRDFVPASDNASPVGSYRLTVGDKQQCAGLDDCKAETYTDEIAVTCSGSCTATAAFWRDGRAVTLQGARWTISGPAADDYAFRCGGKPSTTTITVDLAVRTGKVDAGIWVAGRLEGTYTQESPKDRCRAAKLVRALGADRT